MMLTLAVVLFSGASGMTACADKAGHCRQLRNSCTIPNHQRWMRENCSKTCGFCSGGGNSFPTSPPAVQEHNCLTRERWSQEKQKWCCANEQLGCPKHNCLTRERWSQEKQKWCCANEQLGCPIGAPTVAPTPSTQATPIAANGNCAGNPVKSCSADSFCVNSEYGSCSIRDRVCTCIKDCFCPRIFAFVCGKNKKTYDNDCEAECDGQFDTTPGKCSDGDAGGFNSFPTSPPAAQVTCTRPHNLDINIEATETTLTQKGFNVALKCKRGFEGRPKAAACKKRGAYTVTGECLRICVCDLIYAPVCGRDNKTYSSRCQAKCEGQTRFTPGECGSKAAMGASEVCEDNTVGLVLQVNDHRATCSRARNLCNDPRVAATLHRFCPLTCGVCDTFRSAAIEEGRSGTVVPAVIVCCVLAAAAIAGGIFVYTRKARGISKGAQE